MYTCTSLQDSVEEVTTTSDGNKDDLFTSVISAVPQHDEVMEQTFMYRTNIWLCVLWISSLQESVKHPVKPLGESSGGAQPTAGSTPAHVLTPKEVSVQQ